ncbi:MFS transporter [Rhodopseudomonas sp. P2A-2r]|uniref:MFS transporter n=1 Tax=Rhodopseudomonas sp. P2A-2r TaxID=2991972 RepID=UPI002233EBB2|nr:MFS transporter [Rhodopseudomonas sp. P2A-2r]UZE51548.1 MFS transporter [Rhodopseudomonas sp. P2A-2r]
MSEGFTKIIENQQFAGGFRLPHCWAVRASFSSLRCLIISYQYDHVISGVRSFVAPAPAMGAEIMSTISLAADAERDLTRSEEKQVVLASTLGTIFEWYDFFIYGSLAVFMSSVLFPPDNPTAALLASLGALAAGFVIRPIGAILFGRIGDTVGRKYTFLITIVMMGGSTALIGFLPSYASVGNAAWISLVALRLIQGLAVGGEYGGAVIYVAEHSRPNRRGLLTGWIQITSSMGLALSIVVILGTQAVMSDADFKAWGWRVPFIVSIVMLAFSVYVRAKLHESPVFARLKADRKLSKQPVRDAFARWSSLRLILIALFGVTAGMGSTYFTGQFYVMIFMQQVAKIDLQTSYMLMATGLIIGAPSFVLFGWLSDRIGRKWLMMTGLLLAAICYRPMFAALLEAANPQLVAVTRSAPVTVHADTASDACGSRPDRGPGRYPQRPPEALRAGQEAADLQRHQLQLRPAHPGPGGVDVGAGQDDCRLRSSRIPQGAGRRRLPRQGGPGPDLLGHHRAAAGGDDRHGSDGVRPGGLVPGGAVPGQHPLHRAVVPVSHRGRHPRRLPAVHGDLPVTGRRRCVRRPLVSRGDHRGHHGDRHHRPAEQTGLDGGVIPPSPPSPRAASAARFHSPSQ